MTKYCLKDEKNNFVEKTPDDMHRRLAKEFSRIEKKFSKDSNLVLPEEEIYSYLKDFKYIATFSNPFIRCIF